MAEEPTNQEPGAMPPKQSPFTTVTPGGGAAAPKTIVLRRPTLRRPGEAPAVSVAPAASPLSPAGTAPGTPSLSATSPVAQGIAISHAEAAKKMTSRITVSSATSPIPPVVPVTPSATAPVPVAAPAANPAPAPAAAPAPALAAASPIKPITPVVPEAAKKMTSRITLESAFGAQPEVSVPSQPKTIRLKRPSEVASPAPAPAQTAVSAAPAGMTSVASAAPAEAPVAADESLTRKKTIKVKRPGAGAAGGPKISLNRPEGGDGVGAAPGENLQSLSGFGAPVKAAAAPDKVNPFFIIAAIVAILAGSILVWALAAQTFGERGAAGDYAFPKGPMVPPPPGLSTID